MRDIPEFVRLTPLKKKRIHLLVDGREIYSLAGILVAYLILIALFAYLALITSDINTTYEKLLISPSPIPDLSSSATK
jgi:hypothetical protein